MLGLLSLDQSPPFEAPLRFFLAAPVFGVLAGLLLMFEGPALLQSRWLPATLAATHLLTLGFMLQVMVGALIQVLPVVAGANLSRPASLARRVQPLLGVGTLVLCAGFYASDALALQAGAGLLVLGSVLFLRAVACALWPVVVTSPTIRGLKLALPGLLGTLLLGLWLVIAMTRGSAVSLVQLTDLHAAWGLAAWAGVLLVALSYVVVPMFQLTPGYPARLSWIWPWLLFLGALLWLSDLLLFGGVVVIWWKCGLALSGLGFAGYTLWLQQQRRRPRVDPSFRYWRMGLWGAVIALVLLLTAGWLPEMSLAIESAVLFGVLFIVAGFIPLMIGMLYKIVPFLAWLHLQNLGKGQWTAPNMNSLLSEREMHRQMRVFAAAAWLLVAAVLWPAWLSRAAGLALAVSFTWLWWNLWQTRRRYLRIAADLKQKRKDIG
jgi:hypothetical protein